MGYNLGIDFGTSTTRVAISKDGGIPDVVPIGSDETPEFIHSIASYKIVSGEVQLYGAGDRSHPGADITIREVKRYLWAYESSYEQENKDHWNLDTKNFSLPEHIKETNPQWSPDTKKFSLGTVEISPEQVVQDIIEKAISLAVRAINDGKMPPGIMAEGTNEESIRKLPLRLGTAVVAGFQVRNKMRKVARNIGFTNVTISDDIIEEPVLASMSYLSTTQLDPGDKVLVYDFGGGTFDVAIVRVEDRLPVQWSLLAAEGERELGGANIDEVLLEYVIGRLAEQEGMDTADYKGCWTDSDSGDRDLLLDAVNVAKERLSESDSTNILLDNFLGGKIDLELTRSELEDVVNQSELLDRTFSCSLRAFKRAWALWTREFDELDGSTDALMEKAARLQNTHLKEWINKIILIGGSTRIPLIDNKIRERWVDDHVVVVSDNVITPITAPAIGAAGNDVNIGGIIDRLPFTISIKDESEGGETVLYEAFAPTSYHKVVGFGRGIELEKFKFDIYPGDNLWIYIHDPDDKLIAKVKVDTGMIGEHWMEIDYFGRILLRRTVPQQGDKIFQQIVNPAQTLDQKNRAELRDQKLKLRKNAERAQQGKSARRSAFLDPN